MVMKIESKDFDPVEHPGHPLYILRVGERNFFYCNKCQKCYDISLKLELNLPEE